MKKGFERRIRKQMEAKGYIVRSLVTHRIPWHRISDKVCSAEA